MDDTPRRRRPYYRPPRRNRYRPPQTGRGRAVGNKAYQCEGEAAALEGKGLKTLPKARSTTQQAAGEHAQARRRHSSNNHQQGRTRAGQARLSFSTHDHCEGRSYEVARDERPLRRRGEEDDSSFTAPLPALDYTSNSLQRGDGRGGGRRHHHGRGERRLHPKEEANPLWDRSPEREKGEQTRHARASSSTDPPPAAQDGIVAAQGGGDPGRSCTIAAHPRSGGKPGWAQRGGHHQHLCHRSTHAAWNPNHGPTTCGGKPRLNGGS